MLAIKAYLLTLTVIVAAGTMAGCGKEDQAAVKPAAVKVDTTPVTLTLYMGQNIDNKAFEELIEAPLKIKYPHITVEKLQGKLPELMSAGVVPDILTHWNGGATEFMQLDLLGDITPIVKKHGVDLNKFDPVFLDSIKELSNSGELYGLPYFSQFASLYYNKSIFDRFGMAYPSDGMNWDDAVALGRKLTRSEGGVDYTGLDYERVVRIAHPLSPDVVNKKTEKANINNDTWKKAFELGKLISLIPGNKLIGTDGFLKDQKSAMYGTINLLGARMEEAIKNGLKLGVAQYPSWKEKPNIFGMVDAHYMFISKQSKHKDQAMQVIDLVTSEETQLKAAMKHAWYSPLKNPDTKKKFASEVKYLEGVSLQSIFKSKPAPAPGFSIYYSERKIVETKYDEFLKTGKDVNTILKEADDELNKKIDSLKVK